MEITQEIFNKYLPAFQDPNALVFDKMSAYLEQEAQRLTALAVEDYLTTDELLSFSYKFVCTSAAYEAIPHLDLVATPTGFGVVSNQNVAPASRERVAALREQLRQQRSDAYDRLFLALIKDTAWRTTEAAVLVADTLLFLPCHLRRYGVTLDGAPIYHEEYMKMANRIDQAEAELEHLISPELYEKLVALQLADQRTADEQIAIEQSRLLIATALNNTNPHARHAIARRLLETVRKAGFEEYLNSATYAAQTFTPYQNEQQHPTFFFA